MLGRSRTRASMAPPAGSGETPTDGRLVRRVLINALTVIDGGGRSYIVNLLRELNADSRGFRFTVLAASGRVSADDAGDVELRTIPLPSRSEWARLTPRLLYEQAVLPLTCRGFDLLYCVADMVPLAASVPTVVALRNLNIYDDRFYQTVRLRLLRRVVPAGLRRARRLVFPSRAAADLIQPRVRIAPERVAVVHHGIAPEAFDAGPPIESETPYLFLPAALERHKNMGVLIESLRYVRDGRLELWIAGQAETDPAYAAELRAGVERLGLRPRVRFLDPVPYREILRYHRGASAMVFPSLIETFGHPLLEAMLAETPIVAADIPAFREVAGEAALYFPPEDPRALAAAIDALSSDEGATRRRISAGRERAAFFSWRRSADALCEVFREALAEASGAAPFR